MCRLIANLTAATPPPSTTACLHAYEALGGTVDWGSAVTYAMSLVANPSEHDACSTYYPDGTGLRDLIRHGPDQFIYDAFGYQTCCGGGAASTNEPKFRGDAEVTWRSEQDELDLFCKRVQDDDEGMEDASLAV